MTAKEFIEKEALEYKLAEYDEGGFVGIDERLLERKLEEYHQAKLKLLGISDVVGRSEQLLALAQYMCEHQNNLDGKTAKDYLQDFLSQ
jgi:hypothetical protein